MAMIDTANDYTGTCNITRMVWNLEGTMSWHHVRTALLNTEAQKRFEYTEEDLEAIAMDMTCGRLPIFSLKPNGRKMSIGSKGGKHSWDEFCRSWAAALIGSGTMRVKGQSRAAEMNVIMKHLSPDFAALRERVLVAHTMLVAQTGKLVA